MRFKPMTVATLYKLIIKLKKDPLMHYPVHGAHSNGLSMAPAALLAVPGGVLLPLVYERATDSCSSTIIKGCWEMSKIAFEIPCYTSGYTTYSQRA